MAIGGVRMQGPASMNPAAAVSSEEGPRVASAVQECCRVDLWAALAGEGDAPPHGVELLDETDLQWCARLRKPAARRQCLMAHILLRLALADAVNGEVSPDEWRFERDAQSKPSLPSTSHRLNFSLSHEQELAVVAVCTTNPVGVDVARLENCPRTQPVWSAVTPAERVLLFSESPDLRAHDFVRLWALKEAYTKMRGLGHALDFSRLETDLARRHLRDAECDCKAAFETHTLWFPDDCYFVALAVGTECATGIDSRGHLLDLSGGAWFARSEISPQEAVWPKRWKWHWL